MPQTLLPIELCELIIDFVDDEATLQSTSLVCKAWIARSQFNLFRVVELCLPTHLDRFRELLLAAPHLAGLVKEIFISENSLLGLLRPSMSVVARFPSLISPHPCIQPHRLTVHKQLWLPTRYNPLYLAELSRLTSITSLDLFDVTFTTVADLSIVLRALRHLRSLSAEDLDDQRQLDPETSASIGSDLPSLTTLRIRSSHPTSVTDWLLRHNRFPAIRYMECNYQLSATLGANQGLGAFWRASGATLETLTLAISKRTLGTSLLPSVIEEHLNLSSCTSLTTLRVDCRHEREVSPDWTWLLFLLDLLARPQIVIAFAFHHSSQALAALHKFIPALDRTLAATAPAAVRFEFDYRCAPRERDEDAETLLARFVETRARGILQVV